MLPATMSGGDVVADNGQIRETINNLPAYSQLQLDVLVKNSKYESDPSDPIDLVTPEGGKATPHPLKHSPACTDNYPVHAV